MNSKSVAGEYVRRIRRWISFSYFSAQETCYLEMEVYPSFVSPLSYDQLGIIIHTNNTVRVTTVDSRAGCLNKTF